LHGDRELANFESINEAWKTGKNEGSISESLVHKVRAEFKHGTKKAAPKAHKSVSSMAGKKSLKTQSKPKAAAPNSPALKALMNKSRSTNASHANGKHTGAVSPATSKASTSYDRSRVLDRVESDIDEVIFTLMSLGGFTEVESALRAARRLLARSHGE
jgi:hypothetical protein